MCKVNNFSKIVFIIILAAVKTSIAESLKLMASAIWIIFSINNLLLSMTKQIIF